MIIKKCKTFIPKKFKEVLDLSKSYYKKFVSNQHILYRVLEFDITTLKVLLQIRGRTTIIRCHLAEIINDIHILEGLSSEDSCLLGIYFGKYIKSERDNHRAVNIKNEISILLQNKRGRYKIIFQNRDGKLCYIDLRNNKQLLEYPLDIVRDISLICDFDPTQACYIGILAGLSFNKNINFNLSEHCQKNNDSDTKQKPKLYRVK